MYRDMLKEVYSNVKIAMLQEKISSLNGISDEMKNQLMTQLSLTEKEKKQALYDACQKLRLEIVHAISEDEKIEINQKLDSLVNDYQKLDSLVNDYQAIEKIKDTIFKDITSLKIVSSSSICLDDDARNSFLDWIDVFQSKITSIKISTYNRSTVKNGKTIDVDLREVVEVCYHQAEKLHTTDSIPKGFKEFLPMDSLKKNFPLYSETGKYLEDNSISFKSLFYHGRIDKETLSFNPDCKIVKFSIGNLKFKGGMSYINTDVNLH